MWKISLAAKLLGGLCGALAAAEGAMTALESSNRRIRGSVIGLLIVMAGGDVYKRQTVFVQMVAEATGLGRAEIRNLGSNSEVAPDSGTTSGSRQTLITGEAVRMASAELREAMREAGGDLSKLEGREFFAEYFEPTDPLGSQKPYPKSHVAYGFATHVVVLGDDGRVKEDVYKRQTLYCGKLSWKARAAFTLQRAIISSSLSSVLGILFSIHLILFISAAPS